MSGVRRILCVDHTAQLSGGEIALYNLVRHLDRGRFEPVVVVMSEGPLVGKLREAGVETHVLPLAGSVVDARKDGLGVGTLLRLGDAAAAVSYVHDLARFTRRMGVDLVHCNSLKADVIGGLAGKLAGKPVVWHVRDRIEEGYLPGKVVRAFRLLARHVPDFVIANSRSTLETLKLPETKPSAAIASGIEISRFSRRDPPPPDDAPVVGMVGRISPWKGQHVFIEAAGEVLKRVPGARFEIVGSAMFSEREYEGKVRRMAEAMGLNGAVRFVGFCEDVPGKLRELDLLVHASTAAEPLGQVVLEAMAAGKPVVATRGGGVVEIVEDGVTGVLVEMGDARGMAEAIVELLGDADRRAEMGRKGRARVLDRFTIGQSAGAVERVYEELLGWEAPRLVESRLRRAGGNGK